MQPRLAVSPRAVALPAGGARAGRQRAGAFGVVAAVARRFDARVLRLALAALVTADLVGHAARFDFGMLTLERWLAPLLSETVMVGCVVLALLAGDEAVARGAPRWPSYLGAVALACALGAWAQGAMLAGLGWHAPGHHPDPVHPRLSQSLEAFVVMGLYGVLACLIYVNDRTARQAAERLRAAELARTAAGRRAVESRLQVLQARVEPQFLFDTLEQVRQLHEVDAAAAIADRLLDDLIGYLRAALPHLRESSSTLGQELALADAYLQIQRVRLGEGLALRLDVPDDLRATRVPTMLVLPLIQHALAGDAASDSPGRLLEVAARAADGGLRITVTAAGDAFAGGVPQPGLREQAGRVHALYGAGAALRFEALAGGGSVACLDIPHESADRADR